jgi:alpha-ribazole phosphatase
MSVILIRHTAVVVEEGVCYGASDVPLASDFTQAADQLRAQLPPRPWRVISSPAQRCHQLAESLDAKITTDHRLLELNFGAWELRRWNEIPRAQIDHWSEDFVHRAPPGGESFAALAERAEACIHEFIQLFPHETIICVTHAGVIRALLALRLGVALRDAFSLRIEFGGIYPLARSTTTRRHSSLASPP